MSHRRYVLRSMLDETDEMWINKADLLQFRRHGIDGSPEALRMFWTIADKIDRATPDIDRKDPPNMPIDRWPKTDEP